MKNDKLLTTLRKIEQELLNGKEPSAYISLQNLITEVEGEIRDECNKENGKGSVYKAAERILQSASYDRRIDGSKYNDVPVNVPSLGELRAFIKTEKARLKATKQKGVRLILMEGTEYEIHLDAQFLLDMLEALPGATVTASRQQTAKSALYFKAENGDGILLPLRPLKE